MTMELGKWDFNIYTGWDIFLFQLPHLYSGSTPVTSLVCGFIGGHFYLGLSPIIQFALDRHFQIASIS